MVLPKFQGMQFYKLLDLVTVYAHKRLHVVEDAELFTDDSPRGLSEAGQRETLEELWRNKAILEDLIRELGDALTFGEVEVLKSWQFAYSDLFCIDYGIDGVLRFLAGEHAFEVCGLSLEIAGMLNQIPTVARTTLLPFHGRVVYAMNIFEMPIAMGKGMLKVMRESMDDACNAGRIISSGQDFQRIVPQLEERRAQRAIDDMNDEFERQKADAEPGAGQHRGVLAGLTDEERRKAIDVYDDAHSFVAKKSLLDILDERCTAGPVETSLKVLLENDPMLDPARMAEAMEDMALEDLGLDVEITPELEERFEQLRKELRSMPKDKSAVPLVYARMTNPQSLQELANGMDAYEITGLRNLVEAGGRLTYEAAGIESLLGMPQGRRGLSYAFHEGERYVFLLPDEVLPAAKQVDWDQAEKCARDRDTLCRFFDNLAELRGIMRYADAVDEYACMYPDGFKTAQEINDALMLCVDRDQSNVCFLDDGEEVYLMHYELFWEYRRNKGLDPYGDEEEAPIMEGDFDDMLRSLLAQQEGKAPRPLTSDMMAEFSLYYWKEKQPCARAMRDYLDAHVPDERDDYYFADKVMEELIDEAKWGMAQDSVQTMFDILEHNDFKPEEHQLKTLIDLWMNICNALPIWPNNGWAPMELASGLGRVGGAAADGPRMFFNADGSPMKVGRNDPCPCGSGKKYKKCCGR